jgi:hypothetical protein
MSQDEEFDESDEDEAMPPSLVFLLKKPRKLNATALTATLSKALGYPAKEFEVMPLDHPDLKPLGGTSFHFQIDEGTFWVMSVPQTFVEDKEELSESDADPELKKAVLEHEAWLSVDCIELAEDDEDESQAYSVIGKALAALAGPDVSAVVWPEVGSCEVWTEELKEEFAEGDPRDVL